MRLTIDVRFIQDIEVVNIMQKYAIQQILDLTERLIQYKVKNVS